MIKSTIMVQRTKVCVLVTVVSMCIVILWNVEVENISGGPLSRVFSADWDGDLCSKVEGSNDTGLERQQNRLRDVMQVENVEEGSIFFHETSCSVDLNPRQACSVESAARADPQTQVYVLMTSRKAALHPGGSPYLHLLSSAYPNVRAHRLHLGTYSNGTPMEDWVRGGSLTRSEWIVSHASDALRFLTLYKFGGTYLDLDVILMRPLSGMKNFAGAESDFDIAAGVINLEGCGWKECGKRVSPQPLEEVDGFVPSGHLIAEALVREFVSGYRSDDWGHNGPGVITRVLERSCSSPAEDGERMNGWWSRCPKGFFRVFPKSFFYPIGWRDWKMYYDEKSYEETMKILKRAMAAHVWNKLSSGAEVRVGSRQPYGLLAATYCPLVYRSCGEGRARGGDKVKKNGVKKPKDTGAKKSFEKVFDATKRFLHRRK